ncbi:transcriptional regulator [Umezawaea beigongshangensis]|uniref:transcriptional regulator n=1 Tax=Umezawaea beigongshangensis TaxID=2780383 RepID=UPI0018F2010B|nr:transcriptional regulator [Umezawaea beigongshangensis]
MPFEDAPGGALGANPGTSPGEQALSVSPEAIPDLRRAFSTALGKLDEQIELAITGVRIRPWAGDPVSEEAADKFNERSFEEEDSALNALQSYQQQLKTAMDNLDRVEREYRAMDEHGSVLMNQQGGC